MRIKPIGQGGYVVLTEALGAKINIPTHYDMFAENLENPLLFFRKHRWWKSFRI